MNNGSKATNSKAKDKHMGLIVKTQKCGDCLIVDYLGRDRIFVRFDDGTVVKTTKSQICRGSINNPMKPSVLGVGFTGVGKYNSKNSSVAFKKWRAMLERCYCEKYLSSKPSYIGCTVTEEWFDFQNFAEWFSSQKYKEGWHLDKDLLIKGNKIYSPKTCSVVPREINMLTNKGTTKSEYSRLANKFKNDIIPQLYESLTGGLFE